MSEDTQAEGKKRGRAATQSSGHVGASQSSGHSGTPTPAPATDLPTTFLPTKAPTTRGDLLKAEADPKSRQVIKADGVKMGQLVHYDLRGAYLVALSHSEHGAVLVQPHNCTINLDFVKKSDIESKNLTLQDLVTEGDAYGIQYIGTPYE